MPKPACEPATAGFDTEEALHGHSYGTTKQSLVILIVQDENEAKVAANLGEALTPLGPKGSLGILAIGSSDSQRFLPGMSTEFLSRIGELVTYALMR